MIRAFISPPEGARLGERLKAHLLTHPVGREIFKDAEYIEGDVKAYSALPYYSDELPGRAGRSLETQPHFWIHFTARDLIIVRGPSLLPWTASYEKVGEEPAI